ncbi:Beta-hexosaminidase A precursor [Sedimentisphaera cyanobacteriorum]|uniref:beta-N-acetylhexosaminidase n=1 Tax=Sedimentisphaera cyanobacteriorum TaxID=1940790 RepID=A0A1Q2HQ84_9BACT|nr:glycoside hydrolase family 3 protein [Sedimentisphaera cyanobacteriorum]AQQ09403.1 Beta-hexosaminidase A precursor [Sedimentisphaera cyanobacteriorum]
MLKKVAAAFIFAVSVFTAPFSYAQDQEETGLRKMAGQMLMAGFRGLTPEQCPEILEDIEKRNLGGVILFDYDVSLGKPVRNIQSPSQLKKLVAALKSRAKTPLLVAVDQEGGQVSRLKEKYGFPKTYSAQHWGNLDELEKTMAAGRRIGRTLAEMGINLNLAPCVDVNINPQNPAIGMLERSFSANPHKTSVHGRAFAQGLREADVLSCIKHFPGHGSAYNDSHKGLTDITDTWQSEELVPFRSIIQSGAADMVMTAHLVNENIDPRYPATLSKNFLTTMLRLGIGWDGVVITDDMQMKAVADEYSLKKSIELSINAGADILLFANNLSWQPDIVENALGMIEGLVLDGRIKRARIRQSYERIMNLKGKLPK